MNAVEIEEAISALAELPFDPDEFPFAFLEAFGNKETTIKRLRSGASNKSDLGGVLQTNNIHIAVCGAGEVSKTLAALKASPATAKAKAKFALATDGTDFEAEDLISGETVASGYPDFPNHFGFFLPLAGITTIKQIRNNPIDIQATGRLNRLYIELLRENEEWGTDERRHDMNQFMTRLIFCFFAEDTDIFSKPDLFTARVEQMSNSRSENTREVIAELFRAMDTKPEDRAASKIPRWADAFPYVNGGLFDGAKDVPRFSRIARSYLLHAGRLNWQVINPDIFGSMIQAVADDEERGELGMHYTSVPNILKVLNPLFLDDLRAQLEAAGNNPRKLLNLRKRIASIRVFDPACGSGNFLVIAYIQMREIEAEILRRRGDADRRSWIKLESFYGIEVKDFACEVARLSLLIAEFQCDVRLIGQKEAKALVLPLKRTGQIHCGNALRMDWLEICPPERPLVEEHDLAGPTGRFALEDPDAPEAETYICGNPPYTGTRKQSDSQKNDLEVVFSRITPQWKNVDYVGGWFLKGSQFCDHTRAKFAFVATNSFCQGQQVPISWKILLDRGYQIRFAHIPFKWSNLASNKAGVTVIIAGLDKIQGGPRYIYAENERLTVNHINPYLTSHQVDIVGAARRPLAISIEMQYGVYYSKSAGLIVTPDEAHSIVCDGVPKKFLRQFIGSNEFINGEIRYCLWISDMDLAEALTYAPVRERIQSVRHDRMATKDKAVQKLAARSHQFREFKGDEYEKIFIPIVSSEEREYFPAGLATDQIIPTNKAFYIPNGPLWALSILLSKLHLIWIGTICGRLEMRYSYSNTLGWNTFPAPKLTEKNKADLTRCAEDILLARESHFPATIADLYDPDNMPGDLREAHERNDEVLERIYIGRRFRNDTERLEKLFELYTKMTTGPGATKSGMAEALSS